MSPASDLTLVISRKPHQLYPVRDVDANVVQTSGDHTAVIGAWTVPFLSAKLRALMLLLEVCVFRLQRNLRTALWSPGVVLAYAHFIEARSQECGGDTRLEGLECV